MDLKKIEKTKTNIHTKSRVRCDCYQLISCISSTFNSYSCQHCPGLLIRCNIFKLPVIFLL